MTVIKLFIILNDIKAPGKRHIFVANETDICKYHKHIYSTCYWLHFSLMPFVSVLKYYTHFFYITTVRSLKVLIKGHVFCQVTFGYISNKYPNAKMSFL